MSIIIGADLVPTMVNEEMFIHSQIIGLIGESLNFVLQTAEFRIFNLEVPLTNQEHPIQKNGPNLIASTETAKGMKAIGVDLFTLANNHIMDQGDTGYYDTIKALDGIGINHVGAGVNLKEACQPFFFKLDGKRYGVYACAEHEFSIAGEDKPGANPFDPLESLDHVAEMKSSCDFGIVLYHGGKEQYRYPSPVLQKVCRKIIEKGADLVICQHSHCIGCQEKYMHGTIVYGQGNFLFSKYDNEYWNSGLLIRINQDGAIDYIPIKKTKNGICLAEGEHGKRILKSFYERSDEIQRLGVIEEKYKDFAKDSRSYYLLYFSGLSDKLLFRVMNKLSRQRLQKWVSGKFIKKYGTGMRNYLECEAHRELLLKGLQLEDE